MVKLSDRNPRYPGLALNEAPEFGDNDPRLNNYYDSNLEAASESERAWMWIFYSVLTSTTTVFVLSVMLAILLNKKSRQQAFNVFLVYLMIPDFLFSFFCTFTCILNIRNNGYISVMMCKFQGFYCIFGTMSNCWINALIALEVLNMLQCSHHRQHYKPPSRWVVSKRCLAAYLFAFFVALTSSLNFDKWEIKTTLHMGGAVCLPTVYNTQSTWLYYFLFIPVWVLIPFGIILYTSVLIWRNNLLPPVGHHGRILAIFFYRLIGVYLVFWIPMCILFVLSGLWGYWLAFAGAFWAHAQGFVSAVFVLQKKDVGRVYYYTWTCQSHLADDESGHFRKKPHSNTGVISVSFEPSGHLHPDSEADRHDKNSKHEIAPSHDSHGEAPSSDSRLNNTEQSPYLEDGGDVEEGSLLACSTSNNEKANSEKDDPTVEEFETE